MTIPIRVRNRKQVVVPLRFERAVTGAPVADAPEVDDRGFEMGTRPGTWGSTDARGAMVSLSEGDTVRIRARREEIDATAPLYAVSSDTSVIKVAEPAGGGPLSADGVFKIKGVLDARNVNVKVGIRLGAADGPMLGELEPHIFKIGNNRELRVCIHFVTIRGTRTARTAASMRGVIDGVNNIWRPCGIRFKYDPADAAYAREETINNLLPGFGGAQFATPGEVTTSISGAPPTWQEFSTVVNTHARASFINIYCVRGANEFIGLAYSNRNARPNGYGIAIVDAADNNDLAHELGHMLDIDRHSNEDNTGNTVREDMWARRCLMYSFNPMVDVPGEAALPPANRTVAHRVDVGYGAGTRGCLITVKDLAGDPRDGELAITRRHALTPY